MPLPTQTLSAIQSAGAAVYAADLELKNVAQAYADQVKVAMLQNPFDLGNDALFEEWKTVARLSQAIAQIEAEFRKIYSAADDLSGGARPALAGVQALGAALPSGSGELEIVKEIQATDAVVKKPQHRITRTAGTRGGRRPLTGNAAKVLAHLMGLLNTREFVKINRSAVAVQMALPKGSIGAALSKLLDAGYLVEGDSGFFKLCAPTAQ